VKSLTIATTWGTKYWPEPVRPCVESTVRNWPEHAKILLYPDDMSQQIQLDRVEYVDLCQAQPELKQFIDRHKDNAELNPRITQSKQEMKGFDKDTSVYVYDAVRFSYKVFACIDAYQRTKPDMLWFLDADLHHIWADPKKAFLKQVTMHSTQLIRMQTSFSNVGSSITQKICSSTYRKAFSIISL
jgi:hypothetical protein